MVLLAMLVPMALLLRGYALEDRLSRAALEVQATETVVSGAGDDRARSALYLDKINRGDRDRHHRALPRRGPVDRLGPDPGEDYRVVDARNTGRARLDDADDGAEFLVPVSLGGNTARPQDTPVIRVVVHEPGWSESGILRPGRSSCCWAWRCSPARLLLADRLGRSFVQPIRAPRVVTPARWAGRDPPRAGRAERPAGGARARRRAEPAGRPDPGAARARAGRCGRRLAPAADADHDAAAARRGAARRPRPRPARPRTSTSSRRWSTTSCARPGAPSARGWSPRPTAWPCCPSGRGSGSRWPRSRTGRSPSPAT